jgi:serine/threonine-protein kinase HipA
LDALPTVALTSEEIPDVIASAAEKLSGVQPKFSVDLDGGRLVQRNGGRYIVKPQNTAKRQVPENEHATMCLARLVGLETADFALVRLIDGAVAYVVRRFDRVTNSAGETSKLSQFDFCQLLDVLASHKYDRTSEECASIIEQHSVDPAADLARLYLQIAFSYWVCNGDLHLKNLSLLARQPGELRLSPAYDLVNTGLYNDNEMALYMASHRKDIRREHFLAFGESCRLSTVRAGELLDSMLALSDRAESFIEATTLTPSFKKRFVSGMKKRARALQL